MGLRLPAHKERERERLTIFLVGILLDGLGVGLRQLSLLGLLLVAADLLGLLEDIDGVPALLVLVNEQSVAISDAYTVGILHFQTLIILIPTKRGGDQWIIARIVCCRKSGHKTEFMDKVLSCCPALHEEETPKKKDR